MPRGKSSPAAGIRNEAGAYIDNGWRLSDGSIPREGQFNLPGMYRTDWGQANHFKWIGPRKLLRHDGTYGPSVRRGDGISDPARITYQASHGRGSLNGRIIIRTCDFHTYEDGDHFCMNELHWTTAIEPPTEVDFWSLVDKTTSEGHWLWEGPVTTDGGRKRPVYRHHGRELSARALAYNYMASAADRKPLPKGYTLRRRQFCFEELCVNPAHMDLCHKGGSLGGGRQKRLVCPVHKTSLTDPGLAWVDRNGRGHCRACNTERNRNWRSRMAVEKIDDLPTTVGHPLHLGAPTVSGNGFHPDDDPGDFEVSAEDSETETADYWLKLMGVM